MNGEQHLKIDNTNGAFMPLSIERLQNDVDLAGRKVDVFSLSHYYEQNGDLVPDPDMTFAVSQNDQAFIWPMTYQNCLTYTEGLFIRAGKWQINKAIQNDQAVFAGLWLNNIKHQQSIK